MADLFSSDQLRTLVTIADTGSFTRAAEWLYKTQPALSMQIKSLEEQVGTRLLERSGRETTLTEAGRVLLAYARRILDMNEEALAKRRLPSTEAPKPFPTQQSVCTSFSSCLMIVAAGGGFRCAFPLALNIFECVAPKGRSIFARTCIRPRRAISRAGFRLLGVRYTVVADRGLRERMSDYRAQGGSDMRRAARIEVCRIFSFAYDPPRLEIARAYSHARTRSTLSFCRHTEVYYVSRKDT